MPDETSFVDTSDLAEALTAELETWRKRMFRRLTPARDHFPELHRLATDTEPPAAWTARDYPPIRVFLTQALDHAEQVRGSGPSLDAYSPAVLRCIFGLTDETINATVRERQEAASALLPDLYTHYEMTEPEVRGPQVDALIAAIHTWRQARHVATRSHGRETGGPRPLYGRDADLSWLGQTRHQLKDTGGLFGIWGLEGIGKTALAERFAWTIGPERVATIRVGQRGRYAEDIRSTLTKAGHAVPDGSTDEYEAAFRRHVTSLGNLWVLILDGVTSPEDLDVLGVEDARIPVLVVADERFTAGHAPASPRPGAVEPLPWRHLGPLDPGASLKLLTQHVSDPDAIARDELDDLKALTALMGGHAATLEAVSRLLSNLSQQDVRDLLTEIGRTPGQSLAALTRFTGDHELRAVAKPLSWIIRSKLAQLADDPVALTVLTVLVTCSESGTLHRQLIEAVASEMLGRRPWSRELHFAYDRLTQLGLATVRGEVLSTERLVCQITRYELLDQLGPALLAYERVAAQPISQDDARFSPLTTLRQEYAIASHLGEGHDELLASRINLRLLRVGPAADNYWVQYLTNDEGRRRVRLFRRVGHDSVLTFSANGHGWESINNADAWKAIARKIERYFFQIISVWLIGLEEEFGPDQRAWPAEALDAIEAFA